MNKNKDIDIVSTLKKTLTKTIDELEDFQRTINFEQYAPMEQLAETIHKERKKQKLSLELLSKLSGVSIGTVMAIESGKNAASISNVQKVLHALGKGLWIK